jgi:hypothetical protein
MSSPIYGGMVLLSGQCAAARASSWRCRSIVSVAAAILLLPLILPEGQAALARTFRTSHRSVWAQQPAPQQQQPLLTCLEITVQINSERLDSRS